MYGLWEQMHLYLSKSGDVLLKKVQKQDQAHDHGLGSKIWRYKNGGWQLVFIMPKLL
jgi:hypothetical protein